MAAIGLVAAQEGARVYAPTGRAGRSFVPGSYEQAEAAARADFEASRASQGDDTLEAAKAGDVLVRALVLNGRATDPETLTLARRVLEIKEAHVGADRVELTISLLNIGDVLIATAEFDKAIAAIERAVAVSERQGSPDSLEVAEALDHLGDALTGASRYDEAVKVLERSLRLKEARLDGADVAIARTLEYLGWVLQSKGEYGRSAGGRATGRGHPAGG